MNAREEFKLIQKALGIPAKDIDGVPGPQTDRAWMDKRLAAAAFSDPEKGLPPGAVLLPKGAGWKFDAYSLGDDIFLRDISVTWFGGPNDKLDNGETASGVMNKVIGVMGAALPVCKGVAATKGSPLAFESSLNKANPKKPSFPWKTQVQVTYRGRNITVPMIDNGPARSAEDALDLTPAAFLKLGGPGVTMDTGLIRGVDVRIIGAAKFIGT